MPSVHKDANGTIESHPAKAGNAQPRRLATIAPQLQGNGLAMNAVATSAT